MTIPKKISQIIKKYIIYGKKKLAEKIIESI